MEAVARPEPLEVALRPITQLDEEANGEDRLEAPRPRPGARRAPEDHSLAGDEGVGRDPVPLEQGLDVESAASAGAARSTQD